MSDFGSGYATCLRMFADHRSMMAELRALREPGYPRAEAVWPMTWFNGASDHFYGLRMPKRGVPKRERLDAQMLASAALELGHGFRKTAQWSDVDAYLNVADWLLLQLAQRGHVAATVAEAMAIDVLLGLKPDWGEIARCSAGERDDLILSDAATRLGVTSATLRQQIAAGKLVAHKKGPIWLVTGADLERYRLTHHGRIGRPKGRK